MSYECPAEGTEKRWFAMMTEKEEDELNNNLK